MRLHNISAQTTLVTGVLLVLAMLLVDLLFSALWYYQTARARLARMQDTLAHVAGTLADNAERSAEILARLPQDNPFCLYLLAGVGRQILAGNCPIPARFAAQDEPGDPAAALAPEHALFAFRVVRTGNGLPGRLVAVEREGTPTLFQQMLRLQGFVLTYIALYALVLTALAYFSALRRIQRPLEQLAATAESAGDQDTPFPEQQQLGELRRLSFNLNRMLRRLEQDRVALKAAAAELEQKNAELLANREEMIRTEKLAATGRLAAGMAHEIGNPLGVVQGYLELMRMGTCSPEEREEYIDHALQETRRIHRLISAMLQTVRGRAGRDAPSLERLDLPVFLEHFVADMRPQTLFKHIELRLVPVEETAVESAPVFASADALRQVLLNAFLNAADAIHSARESGGRIEAGVFRIKEDGKPRFDIRIADNGCGLAPEHAGKIFEQFFTTKAPGAGTGLGLSVSLALVEGMGGALKAENREEGGMILHILLPAADESNAAATSEAAGT